MAVARIRTSDPEVVEFLSRHLADSGYQLEFVRPGEPVHGEADLEIDASRMDLESAMAAARQETGIVTVLSGVLKAAPKRDIFDEATNAPLPLDYAEVSPYAQGAHLEDEPSTLHKAADSVASALAAGLISVDRAGKAATARLRIWKTERDARRLAHRERIAQERALEAERRREQERIRAEETARLRVEEERRREDEEQVAAIRRDEMARRDAEERGRRQQEQLAAAEAAMREAEAQRRVQAELDHEHAEDLRLREQARLEEECRHSEERARLQQEQERGLAEGTRQREIEEERQRSVAASHEESVWSGEAATIDSTPEPEWQSATVPPEPNRVSVPAIPISAPHAHASIPRLHRRPSSRDRVFKRAAVAAAIVAAGVISIWSLGAVRRPASPLSQEQLVRSTIVEQQTPFGPAKVVPPAIRPAVRPVPPQKKAVAKPPAKARTSKMHSSRTRAAENRSADGGGDDVVVKHFTDQKQVQAKVKTKNGVKIISESD